MNVFGSAEPKVNKEVAPEKVISVCKAQLTSGVVFCPTRIVL